MQLGHRDLASSLAAACLVLVGYTAAFNTSDGATPYGDGNAPDVVPLDPSWSKSSPAFEDSNPQPLVDFEDFDNTTKSDGFDRRANDFYLRVMPLGASITQGYLSSDENGYRKWLRSQLRFKGWKVNMVGSKQNGDMKDRDNEGWPGYVIDQVHNEFRKSMWMKPNLVLINAGTNDCNPTKQIDPPGAGGRMKSLVDDIYSNIPGVTVILSTIVRNTNGPWDACASDVSQQIRELVKTYRGQRIGLADINTALPTSMLNGDGTHPSDAGYKFFAAVWWDAIRKVQADIQPPAKVTGVDDTVSETASDCKKVAGNARGPVQTQRGSGHDDGIYQHYSQAQGVIPSMRLENGGDPQSLIKDYPWHIFFANIVLNSANSPRSNALDEWIRVRHELDGTNSYWYRQNQGGGKFAAAKQFDVDMNCDSGPRYAFADFNNDGLDDFFCLKAGSAVWVSLNQGGNPPKFKSLGQVVVTHEGYEATDVHIADIDGDGRADYCLVKSDGSVICSRNGGTGDSFAWQGFQTAGGLRETVFNKNPGAAKAGVVFADLNGDFRDDYLWVGDTGNVHTWNNMRGWNKGIVPEWRDAGITHKGQAKTGIQDRIKFGRIYGSGRHDYIYLREDDTGIDMLVWENKGVGGTKRKADGNFYCDMRGTGSDDYVWIYFDGHAAEFNANIHNPPLWGHDIKIELNVPGPRVGIHLADWTGDGKCDVLVQNKDTGALTLYENNFTTGSKVITFTNRGVVTPATCSQGWGVSPFDRGMRLADVDGDGRADAMCIEPNGRITGWLNLKSGMQNIGQVKFSEGWDRANIRFADVENSGRADIIYLDKYTGAATVFKNNGRQSTSGSSFSWANRGVLYSPIDRGETMHFSNQGGLGRADLLHVLPLTNRADTHYNECGASGGDDGSINDPGLPAYSTGGGDGGNDDGSENGGGSGGGEQCIKPTFDGRNQIILNENFPDPSFVFDFTDCTWYSFGSQNNGKVVQVARYNRAKDDWELLDDDPLTGAGSWGMDLNVVSPDVYWVGNKWAMYYSARVDNQEGKRCVGVALSDSIRGPYQPRSEPIACHFDLGGAIDPSAFYDPGSNTRWVVYKIDGNRLCGDTLIMLQQLENDGYTRKGDPVEILGPTDEDQLIETPSLVYENGAYLLFYSSGCYKSDDYSIRYATSGTITGPYERGDSQVIGTITGSFKGPGSASSNGNGHMLFSAWCGDDFFKRCVYEASYSFQDGQVALN